MNRYRQRQAVKKSPTNDDSGSTDAELSDAAGSVYDEAAKHRQAVIAKDKAAKARKKKGARRG